MFQKIRNTITHLFTPYEPVPAGLYTAQTPLEGVVPHRMHLRLDKNGDGLLVLDASTVLHLNRTAAELAYYSIKGIPEGEVARLISARYKIKVEEALKDYQDFIGRVHNLVHTHDLDPVTFLDIEQVAPHSIDSTAPLRLDCALTYRTIGDSSGGTAPLERVKRELLTSEWKTILKKSWDAGVLHAIFTGGEPTLRPDLPELVAYTEELGMVCGVLTSGWRFTEPDYMHQVLNAGLDHLMICLDEDDESSWEALRDTSPEDIFITVHITITPHNAAEVQNIIEKLTHFQVKGLSLSISDPGLADALSRARDLAAHYQFQLIWDIPVPYSNMNPVTLELQNNEAALSGAGRSWLYVEPDGDVLPEQGVNIVLGNLLTDTFESVWEKAQHKA